MPIKTLDKNLGFFFVTEELCSLLANTTPENRRKELKDIIENPLIDIYICSASLNSLTIMSIKDEISREDIINYFKDLFKRILKEEIKDIEFTSFLLFACSDFWPGECLKEIKEIFALRMVDESAANLDSILENFDKGKEYCQESLKRKFFNYSFLDEYNKNPQKTMNDFTPEDFDKMFEDLKENDAKINQMIASPKRNDSCSCGSGRNFKKCCLNKPLDNPEINIRVEKIKISYEPLEHDSLKSLANEEKANIFEIREVLKKNPYKAIELASFYISRYPNIPIIYNYFYNAYLLTGQKLRAFEIIKKTFDSFPNYLFGIVEYCLYLLRKKETEKINKILKGAQTLSQLYPERDTFHFLEVLAFSSLMSHYYLEMNNIEQTKFYLEIMKKVEPTCPAIMQIENKMKSKLFIQSLSKKEPKA